MGFVDARVPVARLNRAEVGATVALVQIPGDPPKRARGDRRARGALRHKRSTAREEHRIKLPADGEHLEPDPAEQRALAEIRRLRFKKPIG